MDTKELKDEELVRLYNIHGDMKYFGELYDRHFQTVYKFVATKLYVKSGTEDVVSATFETLIAIIHKFNYKSRFTTFLLGIAFNKVRQHVDQLKKHYSSEVNDELHTMPIVSETDVESDIKKLEILERHLSVILSELPENYRNLLEARFIEQLSIKDTADRFDISEGNVKVIQNRAIKKAREIALSKFNLLTNVDESI